MSIPPNDPIASTTARAEIERQRLRTIVQNVTDAIIIVDPTGVICFANPAAEQLFGRPANELINQTFGSPVVPGTTAELEIVRPDSTVNVAELKAAETTWDGNPAVVASLRDITERRLMQERERILVREQAARA